MRTNKLEHRRQYRVHKAYRALYGLGLPGEMKFETGSEGTWKREGDGSEGEGIGVGWQTARITYETSSKQLPPFDASKHVSVGAS